jgi:alkylated DNA repair dioxygenase AlkB
MDVAINPDAITERRQLDRDSWVDVTRGWLRDADQLYELLVASVAWRQGRVFRYERYLDEPRLGCWFSRDTPYPHEALTAAHRAIQHQYRVTFGGVGLAYYRDGRDSVAPHRDTDLRYCENTVIAVLSLGARRPWLLQPRHGGPRLREDRVDRIDLRPGGGDLLVMGGRCQIDWLHAVPKVPTVAPAGRISAQWRWTSRTGKPEAQPSYSAGRHFTR